MESTGGVGIHGIGTFLPEEVRTNDWWPVETVRRWQEKAARGAIRAADDQGHVSHLSLGKQRALVAMGESNADPFRGAIERRVMARGMRSSEMEAHAAKQAMDRAGVSAKDIDFILTYSFAPDYLTATNACAVHKRLALPERCFAMATEAACNSFLMQLTLAEKLIAGRSRCGLLVQSFCGSVLIPPEEPHSAWFGDGATAEVVGPVAAQHGVLGSSHRADGERHEALVVGVPGKHWYDEGRAILYLEQPALARDMVLAVADRGRQVVLEALAEAKLSVGAVDFFACHQATSWLRRVTQDHIGLERARWVDTFPTFGSLSAANLPLVLAVGQKEGSLRDGDVVALFSGGTGETWSAAVIRWGRG